MVPGIRRFRHYYATARFMLIIGGGVAFALAAAKSLTFSEALQNVGWLLLCATVLFIDPENPPNTQYDVDDDEDEAPIE